MTDSSSGLDELENRIQRRERSVRPPRKPRDEASAGSEESPGDGNKEKGDVTSGPSTVSANSEAQPESDEAGDLQAKKQQATSQHGDAVPTQEAVSMDAERSRDEGPSNQELQKQIADAIAPLIGDLQQQIANTVRQQMREVSDVNQQQAQPRVADVSEGAEVHQVDSQVESTHQDRERERSRLQTVIRKALAAIRYALRWLVEALRRVWQAVINALRALLVKVILGAVKMVIRTLILGLMHRLEDKPEPKRTDSEQPAPSPSSA